MALMLGRPGTPGQLAVTNQTPQVMGTNLQIGLNPLKMVFELTTLRVSKLWG